MYELAETHGAMMDARMDWARDNQRDPSSSSDSVWSAKTNKATERAIYYFNEFLERLKKSDGTMPESFTADTCRPALIAYFHLARYYRFSHVKKCITPCIVQWPLHSKWSQI